MRTSNRKTIIEQPAVKKERFKHQLPIPSRGAGSGKVGRHLVYDNARFPQIVKTLCRNHGMTGRQLAEVFGVSYETWTHWVGHYPDLKKAYWEGKDEFDGTHVENALLKRALGYQYTEVTRKSVRVRGRDSKGLNVSIPATEITETVKELPPDSKSAIFWLINRNRERWKLESNAKVSGHIDHNHSGVVASAQLENLNKDQLLALRDMINAQNEGTAIEITNDAGQALLDCDVMKNVASVLGTEYAEYSEVRT